jgi:UDP-glucose 4-epimerase
MERVFVTGAAGYIGGKLLSYLDSRDEVKETVGIDIREPSTSPSKLTFYRADVRDPLDPIMKTHDIDTVVHLAYVVAPIHSESLMEDINVNGTRNILSSCIDAGVGQMLYTSSATAYGFHPDNDVPLTEDSLLRGNNDFTYSKTKKELEAVLAEFVASNPGITVTVLRPSFVVGPGFNDPLARHLQKRFVLLPSDAQPFQFVHEDDLIDIVYTLLSKRTHGIFNVGADGTVSPDEMVSLLGNRAIGIPSGLMYVLTQLAWKLRLSFLAEFPGPALNLARYSWVVSSDKLKEEVGFRYKYTSREAFEDFVDQVRGR